MQIGPKQGEDYEMNKISVYKSIYFMREKWLTFRTARSMLPQNVRKKQHQKRQKNTHKKKTFLSSFVVRRFFSWASCIYALHIPNSRAYIKNDGNRLFGVHVWVCLYICTYILYKKQVHTTWTVQALNL